MNPAAAGPAQHLRRRIPLTPPAARVYADSVAFKSATGFSSPDSLGGQPPFPFGMRHFLRPWSGFAPMGGAGRGALQAATPQDSPVPRDRSANPSGSAHPFSRGLAVEQPHSRSLTMTTPILQGASAPVVFHFNTLEVRTIDRDGQIWFVAGDVAQVLGYADAKQMTRWLDEDEAALHNVQTRSENGTVQSREVTIISESGLYHALLKSRKPEPKPFRRWVTQEVLPAIRQHGGYGNPQASASGLQPFPPGMKLAPHLRGRRPLPCRAGTGGRHGRHRPADRRNRGSQRLHPGQALSQGGQAMSALDPAAYARPAYLPTGPRGEYRPEVLGLEDLGCTVWAVTASSAHTLDGRSSGPCRPGRRGSADRGMAGQPLPGPGNAGASRCRGDRLSPGLPGHDPRSVKPDCTCPMPQPRPATVT